MFFGFYFVGVLVWWRRGISLEAQGAKATEPCESGPEHGCATVAHLVVAAPERSASARGSAIKGRADIG